MEGTNKPFYHAKFRENIHLDEFFKKRFLYNSKNPHIIKHLFSFKFLTGKVLYFKWKLNPEMWGTNPIKVEEL